MTKHHIAAAKQVTAIWRGNRTAEPPFWVDRTQAYLRACEAAEAYILLFQHVTPRFNVNRFLQACGLVAQ